MVEIASLEGKLNIRLREFVWKKLVCYLRVPLL